MMKQYVKRPLTLALLAGAMAISGKAQADTRVYPTDLVNIAAAANGGKIVNATSVFENSPNWSADNLIDGKVFDVAKNAGSMGWSSEKFDPINMDSVTIAFADNETKRIGRIVLNPTAAVPPERWAKDVEVLVSKDGPDGPYRTAGMLTLRREAKPQSFLILPAEAKYVRFTFRANQGSDRAVALGEIEIYEAIPTTDPLGQLIASMTQAVTELKQYRDLEVGRRNNGSLAATEGEVQNVMRRSGVSEATLQLIQLSTRDDSGVMPVSNVNIAAAKNGGKIMNYTSLFSNDPRYAAKNLLDGQNYDPKNDKGTSWGWSSEGFVPGREYVTVGFGDDRSHLIGKVVLNPSSNQPILRWARRIEIQVSSDSAREGPWRTVETINIRSSPVNQDFFIRPVEAKYVRFVFQTNGPSDINLPGLTPGVNSDRAVSLGEIEIYEATAAVDVLNSVIGRFENILTSLINLRSESTKKAATQPREESAQIS